MVLLSSFFNVYICVLKRSFKQPDQSRQTIKRKSINRRRKNIENSYNNSIPDAISLQFEYIFYAYILHLCIKIILG